MELTANELACLRGAKDRLVDLSKLLSSGETPPLSAPPGEWFRYLTAIKEIQGNFSNDLSFVSCLMAKEYLAARLNLPVFDVAEKPQGANGLDIDEMTLDGQRVIGEIKTTTPHHVVRFGAAQIASMRKDFAKLQHHVADHKFMFVTDAASFEVLRRRYQQHLAGITVVCLSTGEDVVFPMATVLESADVKLALPTT
ncbi:MAG: hypothetical protein QM589_18800 [Thermomicrobiales bacterium]